MPHLDDAVLTAGEQPAAVAGEDQAADGTSMSSQSSGFLAAVEVPYLDGVVIAS